MNEHNVKLDFSTLQTAFSPLISLTHFLSPSTEAIRQIIFSSSPHPLPARSDTFHDAACHLVLLDLFPLITFIINNPIASGHVLTTSKTARVTPMKKPHEILLQT